jgi:hypothetical protein
MALSYIFVLGLLLLFGQVAEAAAFIISSPTPTHQQINGMETMQTSSIISETTAESVAKPPLTSLPPISRVTPPPSVAHLDLRQRCWNDQGFSVDCAVWTGYRYTWGPATNPYDYWSGAGGSGSGGGGGVIRGNACKVNVSQKHVVLLLTLSFLIGFVGMNPIF